MKTALLYLTIFTFGYSCAMESNPSNICQMSKPQLETFIRHVGGYARLSVAELEQVNARKRFLRAASWDLPDAVNFLLSKKNPARISAHEWAEICKVMDKTKEEIMKIYFPASEMIHTTVQAAHLESPRSTRLCAAEIDSWTSDQATEFMLNIKNPGDTKEVSDENWQALIRAAYRD